MTKTIGDLIGYTDKQRLEREMYSFSPSCDASLMALAYLTPDAIQGQFMYEACRYRNA